MPRFRGLSDAWLSLIVGALLFALAGAFIYFIHPGGFESQLAWAFALLPGILPAQLVAAVTDKAPPLAAKVLFATEFTLFNLLWYWLIGYAIVRLARLGKLWDGF